MHPYTAIVLAALFPATELLATTWDEPWHDRVVKEADVFLLARVDEVDESEGCWLKVLETLAGTPAPERIRVNDFFLLDLCSMSAGHGPEFQFIKGRSYYFFLKPNAKDGYSLPTPTSGSAALEDGNVYATYRHSYHQALVPEAVYRWTMTSIYQHAHGAPYDTVQVSSFVQEQLHLAPGHVHVKEEGERFFLQHVALEMAFHIPVDVSVDLIEPFAFDTASYHGMISAARAARHLAPEAASALLLRMIGNEHLPGFPRVMAVRSLADIHLASSKASLEALLPKANAEEVGFGGNIMDPRVCTHVPDLKQAIEAALKDW